MPFKTTKQEGWMFANKPRMAKQWADETPNIGGLPDKLNPKKKKKKKFPMDALAADN